MNLSQTELTTEKTTFKAKRHSLKDMGFFFENWTPVSDVHWWNKMVPPVYALTENRVAGLNRIREEQTAKITPLQRELKSLRHIFNGLDSTVRASLKKLGMNKAKIRLLEDEIVEINKATENRIKKLLNREQQEYLKRNGYGWWNAADVCWTSGRNRWSRNGIKMSDRGFSW